MTEAVALYIAMGMTLAGAAVGASLGIARVGAALIESLGRQPTLLPMFRQQLFIVVGLIDAIPMMAVGIALFILFAMGPTESEKNGHAAEPVKVIITPESRLQP
jgi:F-type H+-transporting ATPase subunit c